MYCSATPAAVPTPIATGSALHKLIVVVVPVLPVVLPRLPVVVVPVLLMVVPVLPVGLQYAFRVVSSSKL